MKPSVPLDSDDVRAVLARMLNGGPLDHLPTRRGDAEVLLALASAAFESGRVYREVEVNDRLTQWLDGFAAPGMVDHVSLRRRLVDQRYLLRNPAGAAYRVNREKTAERLSPAAQSIDPGVVLASVESERARRKRARSNLSDSIEHESPL